MNKASFFSITFYLFAVFCMKSGQAHSQDITGTWSGTMTMKTTTTSEFGNNTIIVNLIITNNEVTGQVESTGEFFADGKSVGTTTCSGGGKGVLWRVAFSDKTYDLEAISPIYTCVHTSHIAGVPSETSTAPNGHDVISNNNPIGSNRNVLTGNRTETADIAGIGKQTTTTSWNLYGSIDAELIVIPGDYDNWLPEPGKDERRKGKVMNISLKLQGKNGKPLKVKAKSFELRLSNTSKEPGITINFPLTPDNPGLPDLRFIGLPTMESFKEDQFIKIPCNDGVTGKAYIGSYDGGGWTTLNVEAILDGDIRIKGQLLVAGGDVDILIPKRMRDSKIGTKWLTDNGNPGEMDDKEKSKDNDNPNDGDGLTAYEEYRGVISEIEFRDRNPNKFGRLDPNKKEVGIWASRSDFALFNEGIKWFKDAGGLKIIRFDFDKDEVAPGGKINMNAKSAHDYDQYAIYLFNGGLGSDNGTLGVTYCRAKLWIPANIIGVVIDWNKIQAVYQKQINKARPGILKFTLIDYLAQTVAHELGHAVNVDHHGADLHYLDLIVNFVTEFNRIFDRNGNLITDRPYTLSFIGESSGTVESGDISCLMNYYPFYRWGYTIGADDASIYNQEPLLPLGKIFCKSKNGTGINATQLYFGDAAAGKGNCLGQIKLRD